MKLTAAMQIFSVDNIGNITESELKKKYRTLTRKYHPDICKEHNATEKMSDINEAYRLIGQVIKQLTIANNDKLTQYASVTMTIEQLQRVYNGGTLVFRNKDTDEIKLTKENIHKYRVFIALRATITENNITTEYVKIAKHTGNDEYTINCDIGVQSVSDIKHLVIRIIDKSMNVDMTSQSLLVKFRFSRNIVVNIVVNKKIYENKE